MVATIASYLLSDIEFNLTMFSTLLHCKEGGAFAPNAPCWIRQCVWYKIQNFGKFNQEKFVQC